MLYRIIKKNQNKIFWTIGPFEIEYFGGSDVANQLIEDFYLVEKQNTIIKFREKKFRNFRTRENM